MTGMNRFWTTHSWLQGGRECEGWAKVRGRKDRPTFMDTSGVCFSEGRGRLRRLPQTPSTPRSLSSGRPG